MGYILSRVQELKVELAAMPEVDPATREVTKQEAIRQLAPEIGSLQKKGYPLERVVTLLADRGLPITLGTLKTYLSRLKGRRPRQRRGDSAPPPNEPPESSAATSEATPEPSAVGSEQGRARTGTKPATDRAVAPPAKPVNEGRARREQPDDAPAPPPGTPSRATFAPREDSDEI